MSHDPEVIIQPIDHSLEEIADWLATVSSLSFDGPNGEDKYFEVLSFNLSIGIQLLEKIDIPAQSLRHLKYLREQLGEAAEGRKPELLRRQKLETGAPPDSVKLWRLRSKIATMARLKREIEGLESSTAAKAIYSAIGEQRMKSITSESNKSKPKKREARPSQVIEGWIEALEKPDRKQPPYVKLIYELSYQDHLKKLQNLPPEARPPYLDEELRFICEEIDNHSGD